MLDAHEDKIEGLTLVPAHGGVFDIEIDGAKVFSKKELGRFPEKGEAGKLSADKIASD